MSKSTIEYEGKILDIDPVAMNRQLAHLGAYQARARHLQRRYVYDIVPGDRSTWMRLRDNGVYTMLTIKEIHHDGIDGTHEWETEVADFATMADMLAKLGHKPRNYQENYRTSWEFDGLQIEIDEWPQIPPYLEIEGKSKLAVEVMALNLGFDPTRLTGMNTTKVYAQYGIDLLAIGDLQF